MPPTHPLFLQHRSLTPTALAEEDHAQPRKDSFAALRFKDFRSYIGVRFFFTFAYQMQTIVLCLYVYEMTHSKAKLALIGLSEVIPAVLIALYGGYIADKSEKRKMLILIFSGVLLSSVTMGVVTFHTISSAISFHWVLITIYAMIFCNGIARAFYGPSSFVVYSNSIPREHYPNASTWSSSAWQLASVLAPSVGGVLYAFGGKYVPGFTGISVALGLSILFMSISLLLVFRLRKYPPTFVPKENIWKSLSAGLRFVYNNKMMLYAMALDMFSVLFGGVVALIPVVALDILHVGSEGAGMMRTSAALGAALTMIAMARFSPMNRPWRNLLIAVAGFGLTILGFGLSKVFALSLIFLFLQGAFDSVSVIIRGTIMQLLTPDEMRGRVSAVNQMFISSSNEFGDFESGMAAKYLGTVPAILMGGCITLGVVTFTFFKTRRMLPLTLGDIHKAEPEEVA